MGELDLRKLEEFLKDAEVNVAKPDDLRPLKDYKVIIVADDSHVEVEVDTQVEVDANLCAKALRKRNREARRKQRIASWGELQETVGHFIGLGNCLNSDGVDIYFLNRGIFRKVRDKNCDPLLDVYLKGPGGHMMLTPALRQIAKETRACTKPFLVAILVHGRPVCDLEAVDHHVAVLTSREFKVLIIPMRPHHVLLERSRFQGDLLVHRAEAFHDVKDRFHRGVPFTRGDWVVSALLCTPLKEESAEPAHDESAAPAAVSDAPTVSDASVDESTVPHAQGGPKVLIKANARSTRAADIQAAYAEGHRRGYTQGYDHGYGDGYWAGAASTSMHHACHANQAFAKGCWKGYQEGKGYQV